MKRFLLLLATATAWLGYPAAQAEPIPVTAGFYEQVGLTTVYRGQITWPELNTASMVFIEDTNAGKGSSGVFSGFDLDWVVFDRDGDLKTTWDQVLPLPGVPTTITNRDGTKRTFSALPPAGMVSTIVPGAVRKGSSSIYQPTTLHPGPLFGVLVDAAKAADDPGRFYVDADTATLGKLDARYTSGYNFAVNSSSGWVSLGDGGKISVPFPLTPLLPGEPMYVFIGEAGLKADEQPKPSVNVMVGVGTESPPVVRVVPWLPPERVQPIDLNHPLALDGEVPELPTDPSKTSWRWDLNADGSFTEGVGPIVIVTYEYLTQTLGLAERKYTLGVQITTEVQTPDGPQEQTETYHFNVLIPEPATLSFLALGAVAALRRRRRAYG